MIDQFLPEEIQNVVYLDSDIICKRSYSINKETCKDEQNIALAAHTEGTRHKAPILLTNLNLKMININAGVLVINYNYWFKIYYKSLLDIMTY